MTDSLSRATMTTYQALVVDKVLPSTRATPHVASVQCNCNITEDVIH